MNIQDLIKQKQKAIKAKRGVATIKPSPGKQMYRILPGGWDADQPTKFWHDFGIHWVKTESNGKAVAVHICEDRTYGKPCDICMALQEANRNANSDEEIAILKEAVAGQRYLMNVLHRSSDKKNEPQILEVGSTVFEAIAEIINEYGDVTSFEDGLDIVINREGVGFDTKYFCMPASKRLAIDPKSLTGNIANLNEAVDQRDSAKKQMAISTIASIVGITSSAPSGAKLVGSSKEDVSIAGELSDSAFSDDESAPEVDIDDAMLDDLMSDS